MHCQECHRKTCITCDTEMHPGISCHDKAVEREAAQQSQELATKKFLGKRAKRCPGCSAPTQKTGGCDHITCESTVLSPRNGAMLIFGQARVVAMNTVGSVLRTTDLSRKKEMSTMP